MGLKETYQEKMEAQLREWSARLDQLKAKADGAEADARIESYKLIDGVRTKVDVAQTKLRELKASSEEAWDSLKRGVEHTWTDLKIAIEAAVSKLE